MEIVLKDYLIIKFPLLIMTKNIFVWEAYGCPSYGPCDLCLFAIYISLLMNFYITVRFTTFILHHVVKDPMILIFWQFNTMCYSRAIVIIFYFFVSTHWTYAWWQHQRQSEWL